MSGNKLKTIERFVTLKIYASEWVCVFCSFFFRFRSEKWHLKWKTSFKIQQIKKEKNRIISPRLVANKNTVDFQRDNRKKLQQQQRATHTHWLNGEEKLANTRNIKKKNLEAKINYWKLWNRKKTVKNSEHTQNITKCDWFDSVFWVNCFFLWCGKNWFATFRNGCCMGPEPLCKCHFVTLTYPNKRRFGTLYFKHNNNKNNYN